MSRTGARVTRRGFLATGGLAAIMGGPALANAQSDLGVESLNIERVTAMCASWKTGDVQKIAAFVTDDFKFRGAAEHMEAPPTKDRQAFIDSIGGFLKSASVEMVIHDTFARGSVVVNIHQQLFDVKGQGLREDWYIGVFHLVDGKVREWNDYAIVPFSSPRQPRPSAFGRFVHPS
jgi:limonene-1,2-epoxide hydrolase